MLLEQAARLPVTQACGWGVGTPPHGSAMAGKVGIAGITGRVSKSRSPVCYLCAKMGPLECLFAQRLCTSYIDLLDPLEWLVAQRSCTSYTDLLDPFENIARHLCTKVLYRLRPNGSQFDPSWSQLNPTWSHLGPRSAPVTFR